MAESTRDRLLREANEILAMARDLQAHGKHAEAITFALIANERLRAVRALDALDTAANA